MSKPLTMTEAQEFDLRDKASRLHDWPTFGLATQRVVMNVLAEVDALRASLAAAEAKLADSERACAGFVKMAADEMYRADAMAHALDQSPYMRARVKAQYVAARRAAEAR